MSFSFSFGGNTSSSTSSSSAPVFSFGDAPSTSGFSFGDASSKPFSFTGDAADTTNKPFAFTGDAAESTTTSSFSFATPSTSSTSTSTPAFSFSTPSEPVKATPSFSFSTPITESTSSSSFAFGATPSTSSFGFGASDTTSATSTSFAFGTTPAPATTSSTSSFNFGATTSDKDTTSSFAFGTSDTTPKTSFGDTTSTSSFGFGASKPSTSTSTSKSTFGSDTTSKSNTGFSSSFAPAPSTSTSTGFGTSTSFGTTSDSSSFGAGFGASSTSTSTSTGFGTSFGAPDTSTSTFTSFGDAKQAAATSTKPATKTTFTSTPAPTTSTLSYTPAPAPSTSTSLIPVDTPLETDDTVASLPIPLPRGAGVNVTWGQGHELLLYGRTRGKVGTGGSSLDPTASTVHTFSWEFYFGQTRTLLNSWHAIFVNIQTQAKTSTSSPTWLDTLLASSKHYRAELETFILQAALSIDSQEVNDILQRYNIEKEEYISTLRLLEAAKSVFHLCEIMFVDPHDNITAQLVDWLQRCVPLPEAMNHADIDSEEYWDAMYRLTIQGRTLEALTLLEKNTTLQHTHPSLFHHLIDLYHRIPSLTIREGNLQTFVTAFHAWRNECEQWKNDPSVISNPSIERLFSIFIGEPDTLAEIADSWYELMVAHLLYIRPHMSRDETSLLVETCLSQMLEIDPEMNMTALDDVRKAILQGDATRALHLCNHIIDIRWFMAHLTDLIKHAGQLPPVILESGCDYREYLLLEYAATAMYTSSSWQLAPAYLSECTVHGTAYLRSLIAHQPLTSDRIAYKLIALCDRYELSTERRLIQHTMGMHAIRQQRYGSAIHWFIQGRWIERISGLCHMLLDQYMEDGTHSLAAIDSVVDNVTDISISPDLAFLTKFRDLCLLQQSLLELSHIPITSDIEQQQYHMWREAIEICVRVMITGVAPRRYWAYLLQAITPALEKTASAPILSVSDTYSLLACLEELSRSHLSSLYLSKLSTSDVIVVRLALTRNLARAIQMEESN